LSDSHPEKINLGVGAYRTEDGKPFVLQSVKKAEEIILNSGKYNKEYLPIDGLLDFTYCAANLLFGVELMQNYSKRFVTVQSLSGTGALRIGAEFIKKFFPANTVLYMSEPTWPNHKGICNATGISFKTFRYYDRETNRLDFNGLCQDLKAAPDRSVILLHACAHNPTGVDPTVEQWETLANLLKEKNHFPFLDCAYQGFASGDPDRDAQSVRMFVRKGFEFLVTQSFAKNFGLYGERIGALTVVCANEMVVKPVRSQLKLLIRPNYSNPPLHGALIVYLVLSNPQLFEEWKAEVKTMAGRILQMRQLLYDALKERSIDWPHVINQIGMFSYTGLNAKQVEILTGKHHIYLTADGRISLAGLSKKTVPILANAIVDALASSDAKL